WDDGYSKFLYHVLNTLALGYDKGKLNQYRAPVHLEPGLKFVYNLPLDVAGTFLIVTAVAELVLALLGTVYGDSKKVTTLAVIALFHSVSSFYKFWKNYAPRMFVTGDKVIVSDDEITIIGKMGTERGPLELIGNNLVPTYKPRPFKDAEYYGDLAKPIVVDRRFLVASDH
ncbi:MAG: hypothetical protein WCG75_06285, partial [Armatimonadota bacterium]